MPPSAVVAVAAEVAGRPKRPVRWVFESAAAGLYPDPVK